MRINTYYILVGIKEIPVVRKVEHKHDGHVDQKHHV